MDDPRTRTGGWQAPTTPRAGLGVPCTPAQADGVPCAELTDCDDCDWSSIPDTAPAPRAPQEPLHA